MMVCCSSFQLSVYRLHRKSYYFISCDRVSAHEIRSVFKDMIKNGIGRANIKLELRDPNCENAKIIEYVLDIITSNKAFLECRATHLQYIIEFMQKYNFGRELEHLRTSLQLAVAEKRHLVRAIIAASHLGDIKLCGRIIATAGNLQWTTSWPGEVPFGSLLPGNPLFDVRSWSVDHMESLRPSFFWALLRASEKRTGRKDKVEEDNKAMSVEFMRLMSLEGESTPVDPVVLLTCLGAPQFA